MRKDRSLDRPGDDDDGISSGVVVEHVHCYLLRSQHPKYPNKTYVGFTVNPHRRIRQHNGVLKHGGAWFTKKSGRPWEFVVIVYGFSTQQVALQFEWAWQHCDKSRAVRAAIGDEPAEELHEKKSSGWKGQLWILKTLLLQVPGLYEDDDDDRHNHHPLTLYFLEDSVKSTYETIPVQRVGGNDDTPNTIRTELVESIEHLPFFPDRNNKSKRRRRRRRRKMKANEIVSNPSSETASNSRTTKSSFDENCSYHNSKNEKQKLFQTPIQGENLDCIFRFQFAASDLNVGRKGRSFLKRFSGAPDTLLQISKWHPQHGTRQTWIAVYRSNPVQASLKNPTWDAGEIDLESVCNGDLDHPLRIAILVQKKNREESHVAELETTLRCILNIYAGHNQNESEGEQTKLGFRLQRDINKKPKPVGRLDIALAQLIGTQDGVRLFNESVGDRTMKRGGNNDVNYAVDITTLPSPIKAPSSRTPTANVQDYTNTGCLLDFCVAIDFTSSNGDPRIPGTLHDQSAYTMNEYETTILSIGNAVATYSDSFYSVWGFGAKFNGDTRHLFQCGQEARVKGVEGILRAYKSVFDSDLTMSGPTVFDQVIQAAAVRAKKHQKQRTAATGHRYCVLLIITDGISQNMEETKRKLDFYCSVPLSVIFVGVGRSDFFSMHNLCDGENTSFVEFRKHQHNPTSLGRAALERIPNQLVHYYQSVHPTNK